MARQKYDTGIKDAELNSTKEGELGYGIDFFPVMDGVYPHGKFDYITFCVKDRQSYYLGTAAARAGEGLKSGGYLLIDINGATVDVDAMIAMVTMFLEYVSEEDGVYRFQKPKEKETSNQSARKNGGDR